MQSSDHQLMGNCQILYWVSPLYFTGGHPSLRTPDKPAFPHSGLIIIRPYKKPLIQYNLSVQYIKTITVSRYRYM